MSVLRLSYLIFQDLYDVVLGGLVNTARCLGDHPHAFSSHCVSTPQNTPNISIFGGTNHTQISQNTSLWRQICNSYATRNEVLVRSVNIIKAHSSYRFLLHAEFHISANLMTLKTNRICAVSDIL